MSDHPVCFSSFLHKIFVKFVRNKRKKWRIQIFKLGFKLCCIKTVVLISIQLYLYRVISNQDKHFTDFCSSNDSEEKVPLIGRNLERDQAHLGGLRLGRGERTGGGDSRKRTDTYIINANIFHICNSSDVLYSAVGVFEFQVVTNRWLWVIFFSKPL